MDPRLVRRWMDEGKLPNIRKLAAAGGGVRALGTTHSPEAPAAGASFATGGDARKHNIYDFPVRGTQTYPPRPRLVPTQPPRVLFNFVPVSPPKKRTERC